LLPSLKLTGDDVIMTWAGVRPLTYDEAVPFGNRSRVVHDLSAEGLPDAIALTAGPVMTHRSAGRELTALVAKRISPSGTPRVANYAAPEALEGTEQATCLSDLLFRRRGVAWSGPPALDDLDGAARELSADLEWDEARREREIAAFSSEWDSLYGVKTKQGNAGRRP
jgi:glycerol-3-phosphate dehydrogenase